MATFFKSIFFFLMAGLILLLPSNRLFAWHLFLKKELTVRSADVKLKDIGNLYGKDLTPQSRKKLAETVISKSPVQSVKWSPAEVRDLLNRIYLYPESVRGKEISLLIKSREVQPSELAKLIQSAYFSFDENMFKVEVPSPVTFPLGLDYTVKIDPFKRPGSKEAKFIFKSADKKTAQKNTGTSRQSGKTEDRFIKVPYVLLKKNLVLKTVTPIKKGQRLNKKNITFENDWLNLDLKNNFKRLPFGYVALKDFKAGENIFQGDILRKIDVRIGDKVMVHYYGKNLSIQAEAKALENAGLGQTIRVRTASRKIIMVELTSGSGANFKGSRIK